ncbi:hypothetical protein BCR33DRAFT_38532 [Rhizoclosmatium globosum]|uniref:6-phosphofructo-2-kinase domain-containing protein n=1 Tax=Rhizoclosmatium globosum TaxID=329046 RepID=A0A1Y2CNE4_9FUNG|nr:hypothetical protein BCR33DRAFT_38532 [Rhizoclosmatium globosum]|eukprot:ORY48559.1 hypothetical protein BCR33DRAFT_38532 [Rhizoclosmatium globosum]
MQTQARPIPVTSPRNVRLAASFSFEGNSIFPRSSTPPSLPRTPVTLHSASEDSDLQNHLSLPAPMPRSSLTKRTTRDPLALRNELGPKLVIVMCGLPARGKSCKSIGFAMSHLSALVWNWR